VPYPDARKRADAALEHEGLASVALADPHSLSHGQKRRLSVATALAAEPDVLILDEPTFGQDRRHTERLVERLRELRARGRAVVIVTHDLALVADVADRVAAMASGRVVFDGTPAELFARRDVLGACALALPHVAAAFDGARARRPDIPACTGLASARHALGSVT
jgi:energy-coupling factor transport system ATP-binding protein